MAMRWKRNIQKLGRIQIPTEYLDAYGIKEGDEILIEEKSDNVLVISIKKKEAEQWIGKC